MKIQLLYDDSQDKSHDDEGHKGHLNISLHFLSLTLEKKTSLTELINQYFYNVSHLLTI